MEKQLNIHQKSPKQSTQDNRSITNKKKTIKVVYFSNPMKVTTTPSEFKNRVQELTGCHSDIADLFEFRPTTSGAKPADDSLATAPSSAPLHMVETTPYTVFGDHGDDVFGSEMLGDFEMPTPPADGSRKL